VRYTLHDSLSYIRSYLETFGTYIYAFIITKLAVEYGTHYWIIRKKVTNVYILLPMVILF
jgi:hypothetical protein